MSTNPGRSLFAALAIFAATAAARASDEPVTNRVDPVEQGNPHSVDYRSRHVPPQPTNDELYSLESGNPDSVDYPDRWSTSQDSNRAAVATASQDQR